MIKRSIRQFCLNLCLLGAVTLPAFDTAHAQSPADQKISNIEKAFETAAIDVPESVMSELKDVILEIEALTDHRGHLYHQRVFKVGHVQFEDIKAPSELEKEFYASNAFRENTIQQGQALRKGMNLLEPFFNSAPPRPARSKVNARQPDVQRLPAVKLLKDKFESRGTPISDDDLAELEEIMVAGAELNAQFIPLVGQSNSSEYQRLEKELKELSSRTQRIVDRYNTPLRTRGRVRSQVVRELNVSYRETNAEGKFEQNFEREMKKYTDHDITVSYGDMLKIKSMMREEAALREEIVRLQLAGTDVKSPKTQAYKTQYEALVQNSEALMKPYEEQLEAAK